MNNEIIANEMMAGFQKQAEILFAENHDLRAQLTAAQARVAELEAALAEVTADRDGADAQLEGSRLGRSLDAEAHLLVVAERDTLRTRAEKAEGDARWFVNYTDKVYLGYFGRRARNHEFRDRAKPYETP